MKLIMKKEFNSIAQIIQKNKRVLDVGCGDGTLMEYLKINQKNDVRGLERKKILVQKCISKGLSVIEGDAEKELVQFPEKSLVAFKLALLLCTSSISDFASVKLFFIAEKLSLNP